MLRYLTGQIGCLILYIVSERTFEGVLARLFSRLEILELEAARLVVLGEANPHDTVLGPSASVIYSSVTALREELQRLHELNAAAGE